MSKLEMQQCVLGQVFTNCYFLKNKETGELLIVDPGDYAEKVFQKVSLMQLIFHLQLIQLLLLLFQNLSRQNELRKFPEDPSP